MNNITAQRLRGAREALGLSQGDVAKLLEISRPAYVKYETNTSNPSKNIARLSEILGVSADYLLGNTDNPNRVKDSSLSKTTNTPAEKLADIILSGAPDSLREKIAKLQFTKNGEIIDADAIYKLTDAQKLALCQFLEMALEAAERSGKT